MKKLNLKAKIEILELPLRLCTAGRPSPELVKIPSIVKYEALVRELVTQANAINEGESSLQCCLESLRALILYFQGDRAVIVSGALQPIINLVAAVNDVHNGASPVLFAKTTRPTGGAPTNLEAYRGRAILAFCLDLLVESGAEKGEAARFICAELSREGLVNPRTRGPWKRDQLYSMRKRIGDGKAPTIAVECFKQLRDAKTSGELYEQLKMNNAEGICKKLVKGLALNTPSISTTSLI